MPISSMHDCIIGSFFLVCGRSLYRALERNLSVSRKIGTPLWSVFALVAELDNGPLAAIGSLPGAHFVGTPCGSADALSVLAFPFAHWPRCRERTARSLERCRQPIGLCNCFPNTLNSYYTRSVCRLFFFV